MVKRNRNLLILIAYLLIFAAILGISLFDYLHNRSVLEIGFSGKITNLLIIALSSFSLLKTAWHIVSY